MKPLTGFAAPGHSIVYQIVVGMHHPIGTVCTETNSVDIEGGFAARMQIQHYPLPLGFLWQRNIAAEPSIFPLLAPRCFRNSRGEGMLFGVLWGEHGKCLKAFPTNLAQWQIEIILQNANPMVKPIFPFGGQKTLGHKWKPPNTIVVKEAPLKGTTLSRDTTMKCFQNTSSKPLCECVIQIY